MGTFYSPRLVTNGLRLCLDAANVRSYPGSGTQWFDLSGYGHTCFWNNTPTWNSAGYFTFNGTTHSGYVATSGPEGLLPALDFSIEQTLLIVMRHSYTSGRRNPWNQAYAGYGTWTHEDGNYFSQYFGDGGGDNSPYIGISSASTPRNVWNFMCATRNTSQHKWYLNNSLSATTSHSYGTLATTSANITIGNGYAGYWQGDMAMVLAYTRALSDDEVFQNYEALRGRFGL